MQIDSSQTGMLWAIARFSYLVVPVGNVPSAGNALNRQHVAVARHQDGGHVLMKSGALSGTENMADLLLARRAELHVAIRPIDMSIAAKLAVDRRPGAAWRKSSR